MADQLISTFKAGEFSKVSGEVDFFDYLDHVQMGRWQDVVLSVRAKKTDKKKVPSVTVSGTFEDRRRVDNFRTHSGVIGIDLDIQDNPDLNDKKDALAADPYCLALHHSVGGFGLVWYVKVNPEKHLDAFQAIEKYLSNTYGVIVDPSGKDVSRLRYVSFDPDMYINKKSKKWTKYLAKKEREIQNTYRINAFHTEDIQFIMEQISGRSINICEDYHSWLHCSFALADEFGEGGRQYFHAISAQSNKYNSKKCDWQYDVALKRQGSGISIGTFFHYCKEAGVDIQTEATKAAISIYNQRVKMGKDRKEASQSTLEYMQKMHNVGKERVLPIVDKLNDVPDSAIKSTKTNDKVEELKNFIGQQNLRHNMITGRIELDGKPINDRVVNTIYTQAMAALDYNISKSKIWDSIDSSWVPSYNPFLEFFEKHKNLRPKGRIEEVFNCFDYEAPEDFPEDQDFLAMFMARWLYGIISSMHGTHSVLVLVLVGDQGTGKTKFFRSLLPYELMPYYTESKLDHGKDADIIMCTTILCVDDEFGGKSKIEAKRFKEISSMDKFLVRKPYGRTFEMMKRYSVLGGTSNDLEILNDATGNRRLIPINVKNFDWERFEKIDKTELFMELYWAWREMGDEWMLTKKDIALLNQSTYKNEQKTPEEELLEQYFEHPTSEGDVVASFLTNTQIRIMLDNISSKGTVIRQKNLGLALRKLGYEKVRRKVNGTVKTVYHMRCNIERNSQLPGVSEPKNDGEFDFDRDF